MADDDPGAAADNDFAGAVSGSVVQAGHITGDVHVGASRRLPVPAQLRARPPHFTNRRAELSALRRVSDAVRAEGRPGLVVLTGSGGVGKTSLGLSWLHQIREQFPDGQLYADLRGFSSGDPAQPSEPLEGFLRALGVGPEQIPPRVDEQAALYRSVTAGRRLIIMLENAVSAAQVRPLLPGHGEALVVVTTRLRLSGLALEGASFLPVSPLDEEDAVRLLDGILGAQRTRAEPHAARALVELCGRLPLALCTSAARLKVRANWPIARMVDELSDERHRLAVLSSDEDHSVRAVFDVSYQELTPDMARIFRLLSLHPGDDFDVESAAVLAAVGGSEAARLLDGLVGANLIIEEESGRYRFHDLLRLYSRDLAELSAAADDGDAAFDRLLQHHLATAVAADGVLIPDRWHLGPLYTRPPIRHFADKAEAVRWLEGNLVNLLALQRHAHDRALHASVWAMSEALWGLFVNRKHYRSWLVCYRLGLDAARACGEPAVEARMLSGLASAHLNLEEFGVAADLYTEAVRLAREISHPLAEAAALEGLGVAHLGLAQPERAAEAFVPALALHRRLGRPRGIALITRRLGETLHALGRDAESAAHLEVAREYFAGTADSYNEAKILTTIAQVHLRLARAPEAQRALDRALVVAEQAGARHVLAGVHVGMAAVAEHLGDGDALRGHLRSALDIYEDLDAPQRHQVAERLSALDAPGR
ncbi:ATP-binding protein [Actinocorallia sp. A-T 12471]|uniref:ATP-binding protein n=1 Tax=Actinocorallia sp. A-T 12471 TaxID=3089813 RepID=UPI0029D37AFE|nr:NB-ARC domain-containing protein [Actinocorallia sp. A-T 12471]MDX6740583.1 NB-ARC domain-containing protein [Actinocorallia sp. A-T 12471]